MTHPATKPSGMTYPFTEADMDRAANEWGANCGPSALAFALQLPLDRVRHAIPGFEKKRYTTPSMMEAALVNLAALYRIMPCPPPRNIFDSKILFHDSPALIRVQFDGPWCDPGANPRWAYCYTHWAATFKENGLGRVYDCNTGIETFHEWGHSTIPALASLYKRANTFWFPTHIWRVQPLPAAKGAA